MLAFFVPGPIELIILGVVGFVIVAVLIAFILTSKRIIERSEANQSQNDQLPNG